MAKKNKKPNHSRLVVPGGASTGAPKPPRPPKAAKQAKQPQAEERSSRFDNTIDLTKDGAFIRRRAAWRRKRRHFLQVLVLVGAFAAVLFLYFSGIYRTAVLKATDVIEGIGISLKGSGEFPLSFDVSGYRESAGLGTNAIAVLGEKDVSIVSSTGRELYRFQHGYGNAHISASDTRVCVYNRGGNEFTVEGRESRVMSRTTERDILFAEMSPNGALALATTSRFRSSIEIYSNFADDEPQFSWEITEEKPYSAAFFSDNKHLALACVSTEGGAIHSNIYLLHANRSQVQATINGGAATVLDMRYLSQNRLLVVYDSYAALYNGDGEQVGRYDYNGQDIVALDSRDGVTALVFSAVSNNRVSVVVLDQSLEATATIHAETAESPRVLAAPKAVYLLTGYDVAAYDLQGNLLRGQSLAYKGFDLAWAGKALLVTAGDVQDLDSMLKPESEEEASAESGVSSLEEGEGAAPQSIPVEQGGQENEADASGPNDSTDGREEHGAEDGEADTSAPDVTSLPDTPEA